MRYRTEEDIIASILERAKEGCTKTDILYGARLTYFQLVKYLGLLQEARLLAYNESKNLYKTTDKGLKAIHLQAQFAELMKANNSPLGNK